MANESVATQVQSASAQEITEWCDDLQWDSDHPEMSMGLRNRLKNANRSVFALRGIVTMLVRDERGKVALRDAEPGEYAFQGLSNMDRETLSVAAIELARESERYLTEIRERDFEFMGLRP